ncbi:MAG: extracellular solute-binding protein [Chloroflexi bacterium]|nr:extracellular solute-binding protein [Chloroflexota bacterium]
MMSRARFTRRAYLRLIGGTVGAVAVAGLATACGTPPAPTATPAPAAKPAEKPAEKPAAPAPAAQPKPAEGDKTLVYWTFMPTDQRFAGRKTLFPQWGEKNKATIQIEDVPAGNPFNQKMAAAYAAKLLPDLLDPWDSNATISFASQTFIIAVDDLVKDIGKDDFFKVGLDFGTWKAKLYGIPLIGWPHLMHYRKDWFEQEGLKPPTNWAELLDVSKKLHGKTKDGTQIAGISGFFASIHAPYMFQDYVGPNSGYTFNEKGDVVINSKEVREALTMIKDLVPYFQAGYGNMDYGTTRTQFVEGKIAIETDSTSMANVIVKTKPELGAKVSSVLLPFGPSSKKDRSGFNGISYFSIGSQSKYTDLARDFLKWFYSTPIYTEAFMTYDWGLIPERRSVAESQDWHKKVPEQAKPIIQAGVKAAELSTFPGQDFGVNPIANKLLADDVYRNLLQKVAEGKETVDAALKWAEDEVKRIVKEN